MRDPSPNYRTSEEYEQLVACLVKQSFSGVEGVDLLEILHDAKLTGVSGYEHQIDVMYRFRIWSIEILVVVECKQYKRRVGVDDMLEFRSRIEDVRAHKGVFVTTNGFQSGAVEIAEANGIALLVAKGTIYRPVRYSLDVLAQEEEALREFQRLRNIYSTDQTGCEKRLALIDQSQILASRGRASVYVSSGDFDDPLISRASTAFVENEREPYFITKHFPRLPTQSCARYLILDLIMTAGET